MYELNKKIKVARQRVFIFNEKVKLTIKVFSILSSMNIRYYLKIRIPIKHRKFFGIFSQNPECVQTYSNNGNNAIHFALRK